MTKTVIPRKKRERAGAGGSRCEYPLNEDHFTAAAPNADNARSQNLQAHRCKVETDVFPTLQGTGMNFPPEKEYNVIRWYNDD